MWHALRAELAYYRSYLLGGLGIAVGVAALISLIFLVVGEEGPAPHAAAGIRGMFLVMAPLIVGFVIEGLRQEERRERLLLAGPITPRQIAGARAVLSIALFGVGLVAAALAVAVGWALSGRLEIESLHIVGYVGGLMFAILQLMALAQESAAARGQGRSRASVSGWTGFVLAILVSAAVSVTAFVFQGPLTWPSLHLGNLVIALAAMAGAAALYAGRTDFTS